MIQLQQLYLRMRRYCQRSFLSLVPYIMARAYSRSIVSDSQSFYQTYAFSLGTLRPAPNRILMTSVFQDPSSVATLEARIKQPAEPHIAFLCGWVG